ncbi:alpha/beta hydrolase [Salicibibacter halophilus]|uniref:Alpha/beta hydrolase n=1 Tax=Salicibibacter halophilus TaxID=2502791 RepID=A0A514LIE8_9BACI|nr:alpha/beta hydrolase [Salicibibacter halophilus]QDI91285.1 alpha/beta hydrolase [Salicibibacter halophilus]
MTNLDFLYVQTNGIELHVATAGPKEGELVILLHGFPEFWFGWRKQIQPLANAGYKVVVPDQRGYNKSQKPAGIRSYEINQLQNDVIGLINYFQRDHATIIGHDWGGAVAWHLASTHPHKVRQLIVINIPHPGVFPKVMATTPSQWLRSSYMLFFQFPKVPESILSNNNFKIMKQAIQYSSRRGTFTQDDLAAYKTAWQKPKAITSMLNWYRAISISMLSVRKSFPINVPTKIIWGTGDHFLSKALAKESLKFIESGSGIWVEEATHWVHQEQPELVNDQLIRFLNEPGSNGRTK